MKPTFLTTIFLFMVMLSGNSVYAQSDSIKIKVIRQVDGETIVLDKKYRNREEMLNDPEFSEFKETFGGTEFFFGDSTETTTFSWISDDSDTSARNVTVVIDEKVSGKHGPHVFRLNKANNAIFFNQNGETDSLHSFVFRGDSAHAKIGVMRNAGSNAWVMKRGPDREFRIHQNTSVYLSDVSGQELSEAGLSSDKPFKPESIEFNINASKSFLTLNFTASKGDLEVKVMDREGRMIFTQDMSNFTGEYHKEISFAGQQTGTYYLEITQGSKSLYKKITIE